MIINAANLRAMYVAFKSAFNTGFRSTTTSWAQLATLVNSTAAEEQYAWLGQFPKLREWVGDRQLMAMAAHSYTIRNRKFESTVEVGREEIEDDRYGVFTPLFQEMGFAAAVHPDELIFALLTAGFSTGCYDGQSFFDAAHPVGDSSVSNLQAGANAPWFLLDTRRALKPLIFQRRRDYALKAMTQEEDENVFMRDKFRYGTDARVNVGFGFWQQAFGSKAVLDTDSFNAAYAAMMALKSDEGRPLGIKPSLLVVGPTNRAAANEVIKAERLANGESNTNHQAVDVLVTPWLM